MSLKEMNSKYKKIVIFLITLLSLSFFIFSKKGVSAATITWDGGGSTNSWSEAANWSGDVAPGASDIAEFATNTKNVTINTSISVLGLVVSSSYSGVLTQANSITLGSSGWTQVAGFFEGNTSTITVNGTSSITGGFVTSTSGTLTFGNAGTFTIASSSFYHNSGEVKLQGSSAQTVSAASTTFNNFTISRSAGTATASGTVVVAGNFQITDINALEGEFRVSGNVILSESSTITGSATTTLVGSGDQLLMGSSTGGITAVVVDKASGTLSLSGTINLFKGWTTATGTVNASTSTVIMSGTQTAFLNVASTTFNNFRISKSSGVVTGSGTLRISGETQISNLVTWNSGTFAMEGDVYITDSSINGSGIFSFEGSNNHILSASGSTGAFSHVSINKSGGTLSVFDTFNNTGDFTYVTGTVSMGTSTIVSSGSGAATYSVEGLTFWNFLLNKSSGDVSASGTMDINGNFGIASGVSMNAGTLTIAGNVSTTDTTVSGSAQITLDGSNDQIIFSTSSGAGDFPAGTFTINKSSGTVSLSSALTLNGSGQDLVVSSGTLDLGNYNVTIADGVSLGTSGIIKATNDQTISFSTSSFASGSLVVYTGTSTYNSLGLGSVYHHVTMNGPGSWRVGTALTINGNLSIASGSLILAHTGTSTISGNVTLATSTSLYSTSTLVVSGGSITGNGSLVFGSGTLYIHGSGSFGGTNTWLLTGLVFGNGTVVGTTTDIGTGVIKTNGRTINSLHSLSSGSSSWTYGASFFATSSSGLESASSFSVIPVIPVTSTIAITITLQALSSSTATESSDFSFGTSTISAGNTTTTLAISVVDDSSYESDEVIVFSFATSTILTRAASNSEYTYTIQNNDAAPATVFFSSSTHSGSESNTSVVLIIQSSATSSSSMVLTFATSGGATYGSDYSLSSTTAVIAVGYTTTSLTLSITDDSTDEDNESIVVTISTSTNSTIGSTSTLTYTINDDDTSSSPTSTSVSSGGNGGGAAPSYIYRSIKTPMQTLDKTAQKELTSVPLQQTTITHISKSFTRVLRFGDRGEDVRELQKFLNVNGFIVTVSGPGSRGEETSYFGKATQKALIKFQEFYRSEILVPLKLTRGSGIFGEATKRIVNKLIESTR